MSSSTKEVYVLGAGFTKAFADKAPLLIDNYDTEEVKKFDAFPDTRNILELERKRHRDGKMDLEALMTRLASGMPYDWKSGSENLLRGLLSTLKRVLLDKLKHAKAGNVHWEELKRFAKHCHKNQIHCITFNYDDFLDQALWDTHDPSPMNSPTLDWHPNWGYGFYCNSSVAAIGASKGKHQRPIMTMNLIKLHGSVSWRVKHGHPTPYAIDAITHCEDWCPIPEYKDDMEKHRQFLPELVRPYFDPEPFIVPPVLTKSELMEHPVLGVIWSRAYELLGEANKVAFVGYSLPITDIAASTLFRESLTDLKPADIKVVDYAADADKAKKISQVQASYGKVFPDITDEQIDLGGGLEWAQKVCAS